MIDDALRTNPYGYMVKPYDNGELRSAIEIALVRHQAAQERERLIQQLEQALHQVKQLSGLLPICSSCKKIRDHQGSWHPIETYISSRTGADFTHSLCPNCIADYYPAQANEDGRQRS